SGDLAGAARLHHELLPLHQVMFVESNPIPVKTALALMGQMTDEMRLPLCPMSESGKAKLIEVLRQQGLL
ncbi:dihydrodipicolinate synthase family protein, partial [uncultured Desulfovibrio sp.]